MSRSTQGCWTCRVRHKKCDETRPYCRACTSRNVQCHGYDRPEWLDSGPREQEYRNKIKRAINRNFKLKKRGLPQSTLAGDRCLTSSGTGDVGDVSEAHRARSRATESLQGPTGLKTQAHAQSPTKRVPLTWNPLEQSMASPGASLLSSRDAELLMHYFDHVFPLQFRFHPRDLNRGWLLWLLIRTGPLYHAALSLSALHQFTLRFHGEGDKFEELTLYHTNALRDLQLFLQQTQQGGGFNDRSGQIEILACGVSLISFELFRGGVSDWQPHLQALASIVASLQHNTGTDTSRSRRSEPSLRQGEETAEIGDSALPFLTAVVLWFDIVSCASTGLTPRLCYKVLIQDDHVNLEQVMGCENWAMIAIADLASLSVWKESARQANMPNVSDLLTRSQDIEAELEHGLARLDIQVHLDTNTIRRKGASIPEPPITHTVTRVFASAALVQLHTIMSGAIPSLPEVRGAVDRTIGALEQVRELQDMRGLIWPICISGCMAEPSRQAYFETLVRDILGNSEQDFGNSATILRVMKKCWESRLLDEDQQWDWKRAMSELNICALLV
ncbi:hypothetical protein A1O3_10372 [Capronia epimyces CBS 606.96]|uniref:Zn(2)-C6 fungal-type domain-containing protein n=1 Tax=Capronia epimyces CBS 606.96 TaxID=1182542 RepID=W9Y416_9EURO|nr:uncharacterized protein A1O3_10372 [Capronia epimyces CBS 606.96]EXJ77214.1 hypothetical protein A1O3_10372 [Capronia epimyces CBS 606.96]